MEALPLDTGVAPAPGGAAFPDVRLWRGQAVMSQTRSLTTLRPDGSMTRRSPRAKSRYDAEGWRLSAACRDLDPDVFFPSDPGGIRADGIERAKAVCAGCPVQNACLAFALATNSEFGIWGGRDEQERRALRRRRHSVSELS
jgi:WhiB family transcriptional regulator, redox-sensing transcriptional regulator